MTKTNKYQLLPIHGNRALPRLFYFSTETLHNIYFLLDSYPGDRNQVRLGRRETEEEPI